MYSNVWINIVCCLILCSLASSVVGNLPNQWLCGDEQCKDTISLATGKLDYIGSEEGRINFKKNAYIEVKSKSAGSDRSLWGIKVGDNFGYAPKNYITENKMLIKKSDLKTVTVEKKKSPSAFVGVNNPTGQLQHEDQKYSTQSKQTADISKKEARNSYGQLRKVPTSCPAAHSFLNMIYASPHAAYDEKKINDRRSEKFETSNEISDPTLRIPQTIKHEQKQIGVDIDIKHTEGSFTKLNSTGSGNNQIYESNDTAQILKAEKAITNQLHTKDETTVQPDLSKTESGIHKVVKENMTNLKVVDAMVTIFNDTSIPAEIKSKSNTTYNRTDGYRDKENASNHLVNRTADNKPTDLANETNINGSNSIKGSREKVEDVIAGVDTRTTDVKSNSTEGVKSTVLHDINSKIPAANANESSSGWTDTSYEEHGAQMSQVETSNNNSSTLDIDNTMGFTEPGYNIDSNNPYMDTYDITTPTLLLRDNISLSVNANTSSEDKSTHTKHAHNHEDIGKYVDNVEVFTESIGSANEAKDTAHNIETKQGKIEIEMKPFSTTNESENLFNQVEHSSYSSNLNPVEGNDENNGKANEVEVNQYDTTKSVEENITELGYKVKSEDSSADVQQNEVLEGNAIAQDEHNSQEKGSVVLQGINVNHVDENEQSNKPREGAVDEDSTSSFSIDAVRKGKERLAAIVETVSSFLTGEKKEPESPVTTDHYDKDLERILYPTRAEKRKNDHDYCERPPEVSKECGNVQQTCNVPTMTIYQNFIEKAMAKVLERSDLFLCLTLVAITSLVFIFGYYCYCSSSKEGVLLSRLNLLERSLLALSKENSILKQELQETHGKLASIEDSSFGSNDMVIALRKELDAEIVQKCKMQEQVGNLEKELESATEAGLELNKIVSELLSNQSGEESIISSVEELQKQLNEQQNTILEINTNLAEKSRENSELHVMLAEQNARLGGEITALRQDNDELETEKSNLKARLDEMRNEFEESFSKALQAKNAEIKRLQADILDLKAKCDGEHTRWQTSMAKVEALEDCLRSMKRDPSINMQEVIDIANVRAELLDLQKQRALLKERLNAEKNSRKVLEEQSKVLTDEVDKVKQEFNRSEKDKLEAQTRLEVLSNYFKEKEAQLQKELSVKETMWLKQQGETMSTVDRLTYMQEEIQTLRSQNDSLRAEIEAQLAAHKAQIGTLENRAHESWLSARQADRRCDEARAEATVLRRRLTTLAGVNASADASMGSELNNAPSPINMETPGSPLLGRMPPPPFLPPPFMGPPPPFMGMPPPPFIPPTELRPPPLGRLMSPPPPSGGPAHSAHVRTGHYTPPDDGDYDDYDDDDYRRAANRNRRRNDRGSDSWHRESYSPSRSYRSHSPSDSAYIYPNEREPLSTYDTEADFSPPPSPRERRLRDARTEAMNASYSPQSRTSSPLSENGRNSKKSPMQKASTYKRSSAYADKDESFSDSGPVSGESD